MLKRCRLHRYLALWEVPILTLRYGLALTNELESVGWEVHDQVEDPDCIEDSAIEDIQGTTEERDAVVEERLKKLCDQSAETKRALIIYCSHIGGHKFAGNVIVSDAMTQTVAGAHDSYAIYSTHRYIPHMDREYGTAVSLLTKAML